ncbi:uncharacterized protein F4807DRAFT_424719 [Annulohypoxylon truncatum]|uniref:uncharacterized protein n=1 Tax=Annulohypoxylon truncatum TaxID=327061 RepID=UPI002007D5B6|nr:uncharacterized protein F4807DRAFT_424719 [Annulohypoxylon truncatum]KAI1209874.1 hypothetical protein F4807DRAFT_424719 [Annulohypoxylon truncatum]
MGPFALPVPSYRLGVHLRTGKKKAADDEENVLSETERDIPSRLPSDSINPLSHPPDTLRQFAVAGLLPEEEVPSKLHPLFPHKPLPSIGKGRRQGARHDSVISTASGVESEDDRGAAKPQDKGTSVRQLTERLRHVSTMTAILHRCLSDGDIARAKRAFGLLIQSKFVDIRLGGLWAVGSEILMRDGEADEQQSRQPPPPSSPQEQQQAVNEEEQDVTRRWGSAANIDKVRTYFENLIQQHPHDQHRPHLTSALDFWPALFGAEIYNLDAEFRRARRRLEDSFSSSFSEDSFMEEDGFDADVSMDVDMDTDEASETHRRHRHDDDGGGAGRDRVRWAARDELRSETQGAAERIARQMDATMENAPYASHRGLLWLRANLALFVGDLHIPSRLLDDGGRAEEGEGEEALRARAETIEERGALDRRREEQERARTMFRKILDGGGELDRWALKFVNAGEEEEHDVSVEDEW